MWTNPDGLSWAEVLTDPDLIGLHAALTPVWNETAYFADYVLPMGVGAERHDLHSYEQYDGQWIGFRQPVLRAARERLGEKISDTRQVNPGEVWEENEFWIELSWRIDPDGALGIRRYYESREHPGGKLTVDEYYRHIFEHSVPGLPAAAAAEGLTPLDYMRRYGAFEIVSGLGAVHEQEVPAGELDDITEDGRGRVYTRAAPAAEPNTVPVATPDGDRGGRRPAGVRVDGVVRRGFPTPSGRLEFYSRTLAEWGWPEHALPGYIRSHIHPAALAPGQLVLISTFRLPVQIHTRGGNAKWLNELAHTNPLWIHPGDAARLGLGAGDLVRVETEIGHFVVKAWVTEGIRPGVVACSHHMGRWKLANEAGRNAGEAGRNAGEAGRNAGDGGEPAAPAAAARQVAATVDLSADGGQWTMSRRRGAEPFESADPDTRRIWWGDVGVHQNLTFPVQPDPISGQHCWHQAVRVRPAAPGDAYGDIAVDTGKAHAAYLKWLAATRGAVTHSPDGTRRPYWLLRPLKPGKDAYRLTGEAAARDRQP